MTEHRDLWGGVFPKRAVREKGEEILGKTSKRRERTPITSKSHEKGRFKGNSGLCKRGPPENQEKGLHDSGRNCTTAYRGRLKGRGKTGKIA